MYFNDLKSKFLSFVTNMNSNSGNETKSNIFHGTYSNLTSFFIVAKVQNCFNEFFNWHLSMLLQKSTQCYLVSF